MSCANNRSRALIRPSSGCGLCGRQEQSKTNEPTAFPNGSGFQRTYHSRRLAAGAGCRIPKDAGLDEKSDSEVLEYAAKENWIVISHDVNTMTASAKIRLTNSQPMTGLFLVHQLSPLGQIIDCLILIWAASEAEEWMDRVVFLPF